MSKELFYNNTLILCLIFLSGSILHVGFFIPAFFFSLFVVLISLFEKKSYDKKILRLFVFSMFVFLFIFLFNFVFSMSDNFDDYRHVIMQMFMASLIMMVVKLRKLNFKFHLYRVLYYLIVLSLVGFILSIFDFGTEVVFREYKVKTILYLFYYYAEIPLGSFTLYRNQGIFWEPGVLAIYANLFLLLSLFVYKEKKNIVLSVICIATTGSTTGILLLLIQLGYYMYVNKFGFIKKMILIVSIIPVLVLFSISFLDKKSEGDEIALSSYALRSFDLYSGLMIAVTNPIVGIGLNNDSFIKERNKFLPDEMQMVFDSIEGRGNSNSLIRLFYSMGVLISIFLLYLLYKQDEFTEQRKLFFVMMLISFSSEPVLFTAFFLYFIFSGFQKNIYSKF